MSLYSQMAAARRHLALSGRPTDPFRLLGDAG